MMHGRYARWANRTASTIHRLATASAVADFVESVCASAARSAAIIPGRSLLKGSVAIYSNSAVSHDDRSIPLRRGLGHDDARFLRQRRLHPLWSARVRPMRLKNDSRSKAAVLYIEPGGYYEHGVDFGKPVVVCVVGRWKSKLVRAVGHAGAIAGLGDARRTRRRGSARPSMSATSSRSSAGASAKGAVVTNIADIPAALTLVMKLNGVAPDFEPSRLAFAEAVDRQRSGHCVAFGDTTPAVRAPEPMTPKSRRWQCRSALYCRVRS